MNQNKTTRLNVSLQVLLSGREFLDELLLLEELKVQSFNFLLESPLHLLFILHQFFHPFRPTLCTDDTFRLLFLLIPQILELLCDGRHSLTRKFVAFKCIGS